MPKKTKAHLSARNKSSPTRIAARKRTSAKYTKQSRETRELQNAPFVPEERLRQSEERFAAFMDNLPGYAWMKDLQGRYVYINQMVKWLAGYQSLGKTDAQIWPADLAAEYRANDQQVIAAKKPLHTIEHFLHEGKQRCMVGSKFPIFDKTGAVALVAGTGVDITERIEAEEALRASTERLQALTRRQVELQESERRTLARELHDRLGATLTSLSINLARLKERLGADAYASARVEDSVALVKWTAAAIEDIAAELRPPLLDDHGLAAALDWYGKQFAARVGVEVSMRVADARERVAADVGIALFRIAQEALNNVAKHAHAKRVVITLRHSPAEFVMSIADDGVGLSATDELQRPGTGLGMLSMRERAQAIGGRFEVERPPGRGTRVTVRIPR